MAVVSEPLVGSLPAAIAAGSVAFRRTCLALVAGGFGTFALMYCTQPLLPLFTAEFGLTPAASSLAVSLTTGFAGLMILPMSLVSDRVGRKPVMVAAVLAAALATVAGAFSQSFAGLLVARAAAGVALGGLPAVLTVYVGEEMASEAVGLAVGLVVAGNGLGGMGGRVLTSFLAEWFGWRPALVLIGLVGLASGLVFWRLLPRSRRFRPSRPSPADLIATARIQLEDPGLRWLFVMGFLLPGCLVLPYNYLGFRLMGPEFGLGAGLTGSLFSAYLAGILVSGPAGRLADRLGRRKMVWVFLLTGLAAVPCFLSTDLVLVVAALLVGTASFFAAHTCCSSWVVRRARVARAQASASYMFLFYMGSSVLGSLGGVAYRGAGWPGLVALLGVLYLLALAVALRLFRVRPLPA